MLKNKIRRKIGQSTLEYILLVTAIVVLMLVFLGQNGLFSKTLNSTLKRTSETMGKMANRVYNSHANQ